MNYIFSELSDIDFEHMIGKLLDGKTRVVEQYAEGRDGGVDGKIFDIPKGTQIQVKHYFKSSFNLLKSKVEKEELPKIRNKGIPCYILATSFDLSCGQAEKLRSIISKAVPNVIVLGYTSICNLLDNDIDTLKSTVKLWATNAELVRRIFKSANMNCFYELQSRWEDMNRVFVETPDVKNVVNSLEKNHVAVIAGNPGVGKTTLAEYICLQYFGKGFEVRFFQGEFSYEDYDLNDTKKKIIFYYDDFLGSTYYDCYSGKQDSLITNFLKRISKEKNKRFILTSRTNIIQKACVYSQVHREYRLAERAYIVNVGEYSDLVKAKILYNHLRNSNMIACEIANLVKEKIYWAIIKHRNFNPRLIHFITKQEHFEDSQQETYLEFVKASLNNPKEIWSSLFMRQLDNSQRLLIQLVVANGGNIEEIVLKEAYSKALSVMEIKTPEREENSFEYVLSVCLKSILKKNIETTGTSKKSFVAVFNPSVSDYVLPTILERKMMIKLSQSLGTVESIRTIESKKEVFSDVQEMYKELLKFFSEKEWSDAKIYLIHLLGMESGFIPELIKAAMNDEKLISDVNKFRFFFIVAENLNMFDFSEFIKCRGKFFCDDYRDFGKILKLYEKSPFVKEDVVKCLQKGVRESLEWSLEAALLEQLDSSECITCDSVDYALDCLLEDIQEDYPFLTDEEIDYARRCIDSQRIVDEKGENFYFENDMDYVQDEQNSKRGIDSLFLRLL